MNTLKCRTFSAMSSCVIHRCIGARADFSSYTYLREVTEKSTSSVSISDEAYTYSGTKHRGNCNAHAHFPQENGRLYVWSSTEECLISETEQFQRKTHKCFDLRCPLST